MFIVYTCKSIDRGTSVSSSLAARDKHATANNCIDQDFPFCVWKEWIRTSEDQNKEEKKMFFFFLILDLLVIHRQIGSDPSSLWINMNREVQNGNAIEPIQEAQLLIN